VELLESVVGAAAGLCWSASASAANTAEADRRDKKSYVVTLSYRAPTHVDGR